MKSLSLLRLLSLLGFLLLVAPFYDHCNGSHGFMRQADAPAEEAPIPEELDSVSVKPEISTAQTLPESPVLDTVSDAETEIPFYVKAYEWVDDKNSENPYEIAHFEITVLNDMCVEILENKPSKDLVDFSKVSFKEWKEGISMHLINCCFIIIIMLTYLLVIFSFRKKTKTVYKLSGANLILSLIALICIIFFEGLFKQIGQIKWGYYAFFAVQAAMIYLSRKLLKERNALSAITSQKVI